MKTETAANDTLISMSEVTRGRKDHAFSQNKDEAVGVLNSLIRESVRLSRFLADYDCKHDVAHSVVKDWSAWIPHCFLSSLDIHKSTHKKTININDVKRVYEWEEWSQGSNFNFVSSDIIHDAVWGKSAASESMNGSGWRLQIKSSSASGWINGQRNPGRISMTLDVFEEHKKKSVDMTLTQDDFIRLLIIGPSL